MAGDVHGLMISNGDRDGRDVSWRAANYLTVGQICQGLERLGVRLDPERNSVDTETISAPASGCTVKVIPTNEDLMIARHTRAVLRAAPGRPTMAGDERKAS
jgi:hypothetical protein